LTFSSSELFLETFYDNIRMFSFVWCFNVALDLNSFRTDITARTTSTLICHYYWQRNTFHPVSIFAVTFCHLSFHFEL